MLSLKKRILYVDDDQDSCDVLKALLELSDYEVVIALTAADALRLVQSFHFDLYLLDAHLPGESGFQLCEKICELAGHTPVVFLSAAAYEADRREGLKAGAVAYLTKPMDFEVLAATMGRLIDKSVGRAGEAAP